MLSQPTRKCQHEKEGANLVIIATQILLKYYIQTLFISELIVKQILLFYTDIHIGNNNIILQY